MCTVMPHAYGTYTPIHIDGGLSWQVAQYLHVCHRGIQGPEGFCLRAWFASGHGLRIRHQRGGWSGTRA